MSFRSLSESIVGFTHDWCPNSSINSLCTDLKYSFTFLYCITGKGYRFFVCPLLFNAVPSLLFRHKQILNSVAHVLIRFSWSQITSQDVRLALLSGCRLRHDDHAPFGARVSYWLMDYIIVINSKISMPAQSVSISFIERTQFIVLLIEQLNQPWQWNKISVHYMFDLISLDHQSKSLFLCASVYSVCQI